MNLWPVEHFYNYIFVLTFGRDCYFIQQGEDKYVVKVFNWSEVHLFEMTCYKIHTLGHSVPHSSLLQGSLENDELRHYYMALETHSAKGFNEKNII